MRSLIGKLWVVVTVALVLTSTIVVFNFWLDSGEERVEDKVTTPDEQLVNSATSASLEPQFPSRKLRQAWVHVWSTDADLVDRPQNLPKDSTYVTLTGDFEQCLIGTPVEVLIPQTKKRYRSVVDRIIPDDFGNTTIYANPDAGEEEFLRLIVTLNDSNTFAYVSTTVGSYEFVGSKKGGWITPSFSLNQNIDFTLKDVLETRRDRHANTRYVPRRAE